MVSILAFVHIVLSIFLVVLVLIQDPKGGGAGGLFGGGGSNSLFGATGAPSFLSKVTRYVAVVFAASCIAMTIFIKPDSGSVLDAVDSGAASAAPAATPAAETPAAPAEEQPQPEPEK
jgi:preprotein translocase subunit SecG